MNDEAKRRIKSAVDAVNRIVASRPRMRISEEVELRRREFVNQLFGDLDESHRCEIQKHLEDVAHLTTGKAARAAGIWTVGMLTDAEISQAQQNAEASFAAYKESALFAQLSPVQKEMLELPPFVMPRGM